MKQLTTKAITALITSFLLSIAVLLLTLLTIGDIDCQKALPYGYFCAIRTKDKAGISIQYVDRLVIWQWGNDGCCNRQLWPNERED